MTDQTLMPRPSSVQPLPRCCGGHRDWVTMLNHLVDDFTELAAGDVVREVTNARAAVSSFGLTSEDAVATAELIARYQLMLLAGRIEDIARLDPERHERPTRVARSA